MQPLSNELQPLVPLGALLFVRRGRDIPRALGAVNQLLTRRRRSGAAGDAVLAIVVGVDVDWTPQSAASATLRESAGLSGLWNLCWFDAQLPRGEQDAGSRRRRLLESQLAGLSLPDGPAAASPRAVHPVVDRSELDEDPRAIVDALEARLPALTVSRELYLQDPALGAIHRLRGDGQATTTVDAHGGWSGAATC